MQIHQIKAKTKNKRSMRVGRGGKRGTYSGRGVKGYLSRSGSKKRPGFVGGDTPYFKRLPKKRGGSVKSLFKKPAILNLSVLEANFKKGDEITPAILIKKDLVKDIQGANTMVKILGDGEVTKNFTIKGCLLSVGAKNKIIKAGGKISENKK